MADQDSRDTQEPKQRPGFIKLLLRPSVHYSIASILIVGGLLGVLFWGAFNTALELTNSEEFCISCHEMSSTVYPEYKETIHYSNPSGVRASCPDCHVPKEWGYMMIRKIEASRELWGKIVGTIDTPEKFEAKRLQLARNEWKRMKSSDSRECRNCHSLETMDIPNQQQRARRQHEMAIEDNMTCIDCHKGIAHHLPEGMTDEDYE